MNHYDETKALHDEVMNDFDKLYENPDKYTHLLFNKETQEIKVIGGKRHKIINGELTIAVKDMADIQCRITNRQLQFCQKISSDSTTPDKQTAVDQRITMQDKEELYPVDDSFHMMLRLTSKNTVSYYEKDKEGCGFFKHQPSNLTLVGIFETKNQVYLMQTVSGTDELSVGVIFKTRHSPDHLYKTILESMKGGADIG